MDARKSLKLFFFISLLCIFACTGNSEKVTQTEDDSADIDYTGANFELDLDSAGLYYVSGGSEAALHLRNKMEILWGHPNSRLAVLGSSRSYNGVNPALLDESLGAINLSNIPNSIYVSKFIFENYLLPHLKQLEYLVISLDLDMWWETDTSSYYNFFLNDYKKLPGFAYDANHGFWKKGVPQGMYEASHNAFNIEFFQETIVSTLGFCSETCNSWSENPDVNYDSTWFDAYPEAFNKNKLGLEDIISLAADKKITVIGVIFPMSPNFKSSGSYGRYGIRRSIAPSLIQDIADFSKRYPNFVFMDENKMGDHDYTDDMASNEDHLCGNGATHFTARLDSLIKTLK